MNTVTGVFEGGGIKGLALAGAAAAALEAGYVIDRSVGTSAGALIGSLIAAGYAASDLRRIVRGVPWPDLLDPGPIGSIPGIGKHMAMLFRAGIYRGRLLEETWRSLLEARGISTFADLPTGSLRVVATDLDHGTGVILPDGLTEYGIDPMAFPVATAVRMSASVPFLFQPVRMRHAGTGETVLMADGAMAAKFPRQLVPTGPNVIGFRLTSPPDRHTHKKIRGPVSLAAAVIGAGITARESLPPLCGRLQRVVSVEVARDSLDFSVTPDQAHELFAIGYDAGLATLSPETSGRSPT